MSSPRTETAARTDDTDKDKEKGTGLSAVQVAASALAAVSSAVLLSFFGVAGTLIGAALASVISTVGAAVYGTSLKRTNERLQRVLTGRQQAAAKASVATTEPAETRELVAATREITAPTSSLPASLDPRRAPGRRFQPRWGRVAAYAAAVFFVAMGIVTGIELIGQKPVSAIVTDSDSSGGTTIGELTNASSSSDTTPTTPSTPTPTAPATTTAESSPTEPTETTEEGDGSESESESASSSATGSSSQSSPSSSSTSRSSASPTRSSGAGSSSPAQGAVPTG